MRDKEGFSHNTSNYLISIILVLIVALVLILTQGLNPTEILYEMVSGALGGTSAIVSNVRWSIPVTISSMTAVVAQKSRINSLGIEEQIYFGALTSAMVGAYMQGPGYVVISLAILAGAMAGSLYAMMPMILKVYQNIDEVITALMLNYVAIQMTGYLTMVIMDLNSNTNPDTIATPEIQGSARLTRVIPPYQASADIFTGLRIAVAIFILCKYAGVGYEWKMIGRSRISAKYGGIRHLKNYFIIFLCSSAIAGVCGVVEILGSHPRSRANFSSNMGWDDIVVVLMAKDNPTAAVMVVIVQRVIKADSMSMERMTSVNRILVTLVQASFVLFITADFRTMFQKALKKWNTKEG